MRKIAGSILMSVLIFGLAGAARAQELIHGVVPQQGRATGTIPYKCTNLANQVLMHSLDVSVDFWNVGELGGDQYKVLWVTLKGIGDTKDCFYGNTKHAQYFRGGPNGEVIKGVAGAGFDLKLVNGQAFEFTFDGYSTTLPVENPGIFDGWTDAVPTSILEDVAPEDLGKLSDAGFSDLAGTVEVNIPTPDGKYDPEAWSFAKLQQGQNFPAGTHIRTGENSSAILSFGDASTFTLKPESEIVLSSGVRETGLKVILKMTAGNLWANIKKMAKDGSLEVEMSQAVAGIKGTTFIVEETGSSSTLKVIEGTVTFTSNVDGKSETVNTGQQVTGTPAGLSPVSAFDVSAYQDYGSIRPAQDPAGNPARTSPFPESTARALRFSLIGLACLLGLALLAVLVYALARRRTWRA
jgi:hypothetical protein